MCSCSEPEQRNTDGVCKRVPKKGQTAEFQRWRMRKKKSKLHAPRVGKVSYISNVQYHHLCNGIITIPVHNSATCIRIPRDHKRLIFLRNPDCWSLNFLLGAICFSRPTTAEYVTTLWLNRTCTQAAHAVTAILYTTDLHIFSAFIVFFPPSHLPAQHVVPSYIIIPNVSRGVNIIRTNHSIGQ